MGEEYGTYQVDDSSRGRLAVNGNGDGLAAGRTVVEVLYQRI